MDINRIPLRASEMKIAKLHWKRSNNGIFRKQRIQIHEECLWEDREE
jgi:hypothetical protein